MARFGVKTTGLAALLLALAAVLTFYPLIATKPAEADWKPLNREMQAMLEMPREQAKPSGPEGAAKPDKQGAGTNAQAGPKKDASGGKIDINRATAAELEQLPGIGPSKAKAIVAYRDQSGPFQTGEELLKVKGIGPKMYERIKDRIRAKEETGEP